MSVGGISLSRLRGINVALVWGVMFVDVYQIAAIAVPSLLFTLQPGEWDPLPAYRMPMQIALISLTLVSAIGVMLGRKAFAWLLLALVVLYASSETFSLLRVARDFNVGVIEGDLTGFDWLHGSLYLLKWFGLAIGSAIVFLGPIGTKYFSSEPASKQD